VKQDVGAALAGGNNPRVGSSKWANLSFEEGLAMFADANEHQSDTYLKTAQVRQRYGDCSHMWIVRRQADAAFPPPVYFGRRRFWRVADLETWDAEQIKRAPPVPQSLPGRAVQS
jgi:predicted DNA-binding transcriptional regulator AlpA